MNTTDVFENASITETINKDDNMNNNTTDNNNNFSETVTPGPTPVEGGDKNFAQEMTEAIYNVHDTVNEALMGNSAGVTEAEDVEMTGATGATGTTGDAGDTGANSATSDAAAVNLSPQVVKEQLKYCQRILKGLKRHREAGPFLLPVDPVALNIPDYFTVIKHPMDLGTISKKLDLNEYATAEAFMADVRLMLNNCFTYNAPDSQVTKMGRNLEKYFNTSMAKMNSEISVGEKSSVVATAAAVPASRPKRESISVAGGQAGARRASSPSGSLTFCSAVLRELMKKTNSHLNWPFMMPVDPVALNIPDYFDVIKQPMDLGTIRKKLDTGMYARPEQFESDVRLIFSNCYTYNPPESDVCKMAKELESLFEQKMAQKPEKKVSHSAASHSAASSGIVSSSSTATMASISNQPHHHHHHHSNSFIPSSASQLIPGLDALEDDSEKILAINHQIQILQAELNFLLLNRKSSSSASIRSIPESTGGTKQSVSGAAKPKKKPSAPSTLSSAKAAAPAAAAAVSEEMSFEEKRQLSEDVSNLPQENMMRVLEIIQECMPNLHSNGDSDVIELDIEALDVRTLRTLQNYIWECQNPGKKRNKPSVPGKQLTKKSKNEEVTDSKEASNNLTSNNLTINNNASNNYDSSSSSSSEDDD